MNEELKKPEYANLELVDTVYGDDEDQKSYTEAQGLMTKHPDLKVIIAPTTVGIAASTRAVPDANKPGDTFSAGKLGEYTVADDCTVLLGKPTVFNKDNIDQFDF